MINIRKLEAELWESADLLRVGSKLTSNQCYTVSVFTYEYVYTRYRVAA